MKFKSLYEKAKQVDNLIDEHIKTTGTHFASREALQEIVPTIFPDAIVVNFGLHKLVFQLKHKSHELVLKLGKSEAIEVDHKAYKQMPKIFRHAYFARVFWHTKYCLLQEYGVETEVSKEELAEIRIIASKYGLLDITCDNIRRVNGNLKIIDASIAPLGMYSLWKTADVIKLGLPDTIRKIIRKVRMLISSKEK